MSNTVDFRWLKNGDSLFVETDNSRTDIVSDSKERFYRLPQGYKRAGDILVKQAGSHELDRRNILYSALFCYRQAFELYMKKLIIELDENSELNHDLKTLWLTFQGLSRKRNDFEQLGDAAMEAIVNEMDKADKTSQGFRYPFDSKGRQFAFGLKNLDLENLLEVMQAVQDYFECSYEQFLFENDTWS